MHGLIARLGPSGLTVDGPRSGAPTTITDVLGADGVQVGAVYGPVSVAEADGIVAALILGGDPLGPDVPWIGVALSQNRGLASAASTMMPSGLFWSSKDGELIVASDPISAAGARPRTDPEYVREYVSGTIGPFAAPFLGVQRVPAGRTVTWDRADTAPSVFEWSGPNYWPEPTLEGGEALEAYLAAFDRVVADLARRAGGVVTTVSGGLDSTFLAASLAEVTPDSSLVRGLTYAPIPEAHLHSDADESVLALLMADRYPTRLTVERVVNSDHTRPLHAAATAARRAGVPTFNPANQPWLTRMRETAAADGARMWFVGTNGNAAFSYHHPYAADYYLRRGDVRGLRTLASDGGLRARVLGPLRRQHIGPRTADQAHMDRMEYLTWLARGATGLPAAGNPSAMEGVLMADPFASRAVTGIAASITPAEWARGGVGRGFARRACLGRVPDAIRLRTGRGLQGRDAWYVIRNDRDDYLDRVTAMSATAGLEGVDIDSIAGRVATWPWGQLEGPAWLEHLDVDRLLTVAEFAGGWSAT